MNPPFLSMVAIWRSAKITIHGTHAGRTPGICPSPIEPSLTSYSGWLVYKKIEVLLPRTSTSGILCLSDLADERVRAYNIHLGSKGHYTRYIRIFIR